MKLKVLLFLCGISVFSLRAAEDAPIAFLKGVELYVTDAGGANPRRLDHDPREKSMLRWDVYRERISYLVSRANGESGEMAIIVELDAAGSVVLEAPIPHDDFMRFVEDVEWLPSGEARLGGSVNPRNCVLQDLEPRTGKVTNGRIGKCSSFVSSPDGKHTVELGVIPQTDDDHRFDSVDFDSPPDYQPAAYGGGGHNVFIPAGPIWSPDSQSVVFLEKRADTGEAAVVFLSFAHVATRIPVPVFLLDNPAIA